MWGWGLALVVASILTADLDLDCATPDAARALIGRVALSEIEGAEDIQRAAMWDAFGHCPPGSERDRCVAEVTRRFEEDWDRQKAAIEAKYRRLREDFEERCRASIT